MTDKMGNISNVELITLEKVIRKKATLVIF